MVERMSDGEREKLDQIQIDHFDSVLSVTEKKTVHNFIDVPFFSLSLFFDSGRTSTTHIAHGVSINHPTINCAFVMLFFLFVTCACNMRLLCVCVCVQFSISVWRFTLHRINLFVQNGMINQFSIFENCTNVERDSKRVKENVRATTTWKIVKDERAKRDGASLSPIRLYYTVRWATGLQSERAQARESDDFNEIGHFAIGQSKICVIQ